MKKFTSKLASLLALAATALLASVPVAAYAQAFSGSGTAASTNSYYVISPNAGSGIPIVTFFEATLTTSEVSNAVAKVRFWKPSAEIGLSASNSASATTINGPTNGLAAGDVLVFWKKVPESFQRLTVASLSGSVITVNETITAGQSIVSPSRDQLFKMALNSWVTGGSSLNPASSYADKITRSSPMSPIFVGKVAQPNMVEAMGTNSPVLNAVAGLFILPK